MSEVLGTLLSVVKPRPQLAKREVDLVTLSPGVNQFITQPANIGHDTIETALQRFRDRMIDGRSTLSDFTAVQRVRGDLSDAVRSVVQSGHGNRARLLRGVPREVDRA